MLCLAIITINETGTAWLTKDFILIKEAEETCTISHLLK